MALFEFKPADILRSQNLENEKWYQWQITEFSEPVANANKNGLNVKFTLTLIDSGTDLDGKEVQSTKSISSNGRTYMSSLLPLIAAVKGVKLDDLPKEGFSFETSDILGKKVDGKHKLELYEGRMVARVEDFLPYKASTNAVPF